MNLVYQNREKQLNLLTDEHKSIGKERICVSPFGNRINVLIEEQNRIFQKGTRDHLIFNHNRFNVNIYSADNIPAGIKYIIPVGVHESPTTWAGHSGVFESIFNLIPEQYLVDLREGRAHILFDNSLEGYEDPKLFDFLFNESLRLNIPIENIIFISGNSQLEYRAEEWAARTGKTPPIAFGYTHFEFDMYLNGVNFNREGQYIPTFKDHREYKAANLPLIKTYNCLNRKPRNHRIVFFNKLFHSGLIPKGLVSMNRWENEIINEAIALDNHIPNVDELEHSAQFTPMMWDGKDNLSNADQKINRLNEKAMLNSWITVVSEAQYEDSHKTVFLSEKTFKPIACSHPFIILGSKGSLKELKSMGYVTFDNLIDESYDDLDNIERMEAIAYILRNLSDNPDPLQWLDWLEDRITYNKDVLQFNTLFNPPKGFHKLSKLCN